MLTTIGITMVLWKKPLWEKAPAKELQLKVMGSRLRTARQRVIKVQHLYMKTPIQMVLRASPTSSYGPSIISNVAMILV